MIKYIVSICIVAGFFLTLTLYCFPIVSTIINFTFFIELFSFIFCGFSRIYIIILILVWPKIYKISFKI